MNPAAGKLRRSVGRAGPVVAALLLGVAMVSSAALSYRDAQVAASAVAEVQGIAFLHRAESGLQHRARAGEHAASLTAALEANRSLGLTYIGLLEAGALIAEVGEPLLSQTTPVVGAPAFGRDRVRMVSPGDRPRGPPPGGPDRRPPGPPPARDGLPPSDQGPPRGGPPPIQQLVIEFVPLGSTNVLRRALTVLVLSCGAAGFLSFAAFVLWSGARRREREEARLGAQQHLAHLGEMSAVLAHEIRNPLAALKGHAQLLAEKVTDAAIKTRVDRVVSEAIRLETLTNDLLAFARSGTIQIAPADPAALLRQATQQLAPARIALSLADAPASWPLDVGRVEQVLLNLLENALAVTPAAEMIDAAVTVDGATLVFSVRDRGPGVPADERARIFQPFHTTKVRGTGLGLSVAQRIVQLHGGRIDVGDAAGGGAVFRVCIPGGPAAK